MSPATSTRVRAGAEMAERLARALLEGRRLRHTQGVANRACSPAVSRAARIGQPTAVLRPTRVHPMLADIGEHLSVTTATVGMPKPLLDKRRTRASLITMWTFVLGPFVGLLAAVPIAWGWGLSIVDVVLAITLYLIAGFGVTAGYHRMLTHGSFKARRWLRITLAVAGSMAIQGSPAHWVATHRRHHAFSDREGDPHSPWRYGTGVIAVLKGLGYAHMGWMLRRELSNRTRFAPDLLADRDMRVVGRLFGPLALLSLLAPAVVGGLVTGTWIGAFTAFFWAGVMRMAFLHHVTWSVNSICHVFGERPFMSKDRATNFWPLAIVSFGESWHNSHHADPTCARHGVLRGQIDPSARLIWIFEALGWAYDVRWPVRERLDAKRSRTT